jgi:hypothetical protein
MKFIVNIGSLVALAAAAADPQITARAVEPRQNIDPAFLGYVSASKTCRCSSTSTAKDLCIQYASRSISNRQSNRILTNLFMNI